MRTGAINDRLLKHGRQQTKRNGKKTISGSQPNHFHFATNSNVNKLIFGFTYTLDYLFSKELRFDYQ
ncbi:Hypothetical predicted protein [Octopus vulgaris]|uniref:Uncharacterized protein n=1 Tax=Octopus vulgaris TaxID=6645 RepID=A0AA36BD48_OCTVU|nr:Hypothetical predicted protein [Octopus vulgaris]